MTYNLDYLARGCILSQHTAGSIRFCLKVQNWRRDNGIKVQIPWMKWILSVVSRRDGITKSGIPGSSYSRLAGIGNFVVCAALIMVITSGGLHAATPVASRPAATAKDKTAPAATNMRITSILKALQSRGQSLHNFQAHLVVLVHHLRTDEKDMNIGHIWYRHHKGKTEFDIRFNTLVVDGAIAKRHADHDLVFDGHWLIDRNGSAKIFRKIEIAPPGHKFNPLRLGQGPIPIPIGQQPLEVKKEFHIYLPTNKTMPPDTVALRLTPRDKKAFSFVAVKFWIDTKTWLPMKIVRIAPDGTPTTAILSKVVINHPWHHHFHLSPPGSGWTVEIRPYHKK